MDLEQICKSLKETREKRKLSLKETSNLTKLAPLVIKRIEEVENLEEMSQFYLKGFLKIYASALGRNDLIEEIEKYFSQEKPPSSPKKTPLKKISKHKKPQKPTPITSIQTPFLKLGKKVWLLILIGLLLLLLYISLRPKLLKEPPSSKKETESQKEENIPQKIILRPFATILTKGKVFIEVRTDSELIFQGILLEGNKESWQAKKKLEIKISNPSLVSLEIGGKLIPTSNIKRPTLYIVDSTGFRIKK